MTIPKVLHEIKGKLKVYKAFRMIIALLTVTM